MLPPESACTTAAASSVPARAAAARQAYRTRGPEPARLPGREQCPIVLEQLIGRDKALDPQPWLAGRGSHQGDWRVAHLVAAIDIEGALSGNARRHRAGVVLPSGTGVKLAGVSCSGSMDIDIRCTLLASGPRRR